MTRPLYSLAIAASSLLAAAACGQARTAEHRPRTFERRPAGDAVDDGQDRRATPDRQDVRAAQDAPATREQAGGQGRPAIVETQPPPPHEANGDSYDVREYRLPGRGGYAWPPGTYWPPGAIQFYDPFGTQWAIMQAYEAGRLAERYDAEQERAQRDAAERRQRAATAHGRALEAGLEKLKAGEYARAISALTLAAKLNQGDPACRIHLAQARLALGHYDLAARVLRRALQLQPKLIYVDLKLDSYYPDDVSLKEFSTSLGKWIGEHGATPEIHFLAGFVDFERGEFAAAHESLVQAARGLKRDDLTRDLLELTRGDEVATVLTAPAPKTESAK